jgi:hypothetical protein
METLYGLKRKTTNRWLKFLLLLFVAVGFGIPNLNAQTKAIKVANNQQLIEAMGNSSVGSIAFESGYYEYLNINAKTGTRLFLAEKEGGNRANDCKYFIIDANYCIPTTVITVDPIGTPNHPIPPGNYYLGTAEAGHNDISFCGCCPPVPNMGKWEFIPAESSMAPGDTLYFASDSSQYLMDFYVTGPGVYALKYSWGSPYNSYVKTNYIFRGPENVEISAPDVCGTSTTVDFTLDGLDEFTYTVDWQLKDSVTGIIETITGPQATGEFTLDVPECGYYRLYAIVHSHSDNLDEDDCPAVTSILIDFSCDPIADAGPDQYICDDVCFLINGTTSLPPDRRSNGWTINWEYIPANGALTIIPAHDSVVEVCRDETVCAYGEYQIVMSVINGQCDDTDTMTSIFYEQPTAIAGPDQHLCNTFSFSLAAVAYQYCGVEGTNYWSDHFWTVVSSADPNAVITFSPDANDPNATVTITSTADCPFGAYEFTWNEYNSKGANLGGCDAHDNVIVTIYEDPAPNAGEDMVFCNTFAFSLYGIGDAPCYQNTVVKYSWEKSEEPGHCLVTFNTPNAIQPGVVIGQCDPDSCQYGEYIFTLTQANGYLDDAGAFQTVCSTTDDVSVWILEEVNANAGADQHLCGDFAFSLVAVPTAFCGEEGVNYFESGVWSFYSGPTDAVTFGDATEPLTSVTIDETAVECPYGVYTFIWTEYNMVNGQGCQGTDTVSIFIDEVPEDVNAGLDKEYCETEITTTNNNLVFGLEGALDAPCSPNTTAYTFHWDVVSQPDACSITIEPFSLVPSVTIGECTSCKYGEYVFSLTQENGYIDATGAFVMVCEYTDEVSVWIYQQPIDVVAGEDQNLCNDFTFDLSATGFTYCGDFGVNYNNWYSWTLVSQPSGAGCGVVITNGTTTNASVSVEDCTGPCKYGEYVFRFSEYNGSENVNCYAFDEVSVFIFEQPVADAGDDYHACVDIANSPYILNMTGSMEYCYSMYGVWAKSCGPGDVVFDDLYSTESAVTFIEPGRYTFTWTASNAACEDADTVLIDLIETPTAFAGNSNLQAPCDLLCIDLGLAEVDKYEYFGTASGECPNFWDNAHWIYVSGPCNDPAEVTFAPDNTFADADLCVSNYGGYTIGWVELNKPADKDYYCSDTTLVFVEFYETPDPFAGDDATICGNCYTLQGVQYEYLPPCNQHLNDAYFWTALEGNPGPVSISDPLSLTPQVCITDDPYGLYYGTYGFVLHESNGNCFGTDTVYITYNKIPDPIPICFNNNPNYCGDNGGNRPIDFTYSGCLQPNGVIDVCAEGCTTFNVWPFCSDCFPGFNQWDPAFFGWTFEWTVSGPAGTSVNAEPGYYDFQNNQWHYPYLNVCWGECCDTARIYLTITTPEGCENTMEYKAFVHHKPCVNIEGPAVAEVGTTETYCNVCPPNPCLLYTWAVVHCGVIESGQGTSCINVHWTDYNINGGWGMVTVCVLDTCTGCSNTDTLMVKIYPEGTLGQATLSGHVYYQNAGSTPLNGVEIQLWNGGIPVQTTASFNDIENGNGVGYYEFPGINGTTNFGITATYDAPWYGANATDALAVELKVVNSLPPAFLFNPLVAEAMDVNNSAVISATDALWIKQRAISMVTYFPAGNWVFNPGMSSTAGTYDIYTLNAGDANRTNIPNSGKAAPAIALVNDGTMNVVIGQEYELPIRIADANQFGAITLSLDYNSALINVTDVVPTDGMISNISNGNVSIAWSSVNPMVLSENDVVVTLKVKALGEFTSTSDLFSVGSLSEFAGPSASVIEPVTLKTASLSTEAAPADYFLSANRPNPFSNSTTIDYTMPETGKVKLSVLDMLGQEIAVLVDATQTAGSYSVEFSAAGLSTGVYIYKITVDGETRDFISTQRMVISH